MSAVDLTLVILAGLAAACLFTITGALLVLVHYAERGLDLLEHLTDIADDLTTFDPTDTDRRDRGDPPNPAIIRTEPIDE